MSAVEIIRKGAQDAAIALVRMALDEAGYPLLDVIRCEDDLGFQLYSDHRCNCGGAHIANINPEAGIDPRVMWRAHFLTSNVIGRAMEVCVDCFLINYSGAGPADCTHPKTWG